MTQLDLSGPDSELESESSPKLGRKRDHSRDPEILEAALEVLAESGYDGMTIDMVAARAKAGKGTLYRRWASKGELVVDAVACMKRGQYDVVPDTGTLRGDLVAMIKPASIEDGERKLQIMAGVMSMISRSPELSDAINDAIIRPRAEVNRLFLRRAMERGEIASDIDVETLSLVTPAMAAYRTLILKKPVDREFLLAMIDHVMLPAVGLGSAASAPAQAAPVGA